MNELVTILNEHAFVLFTLVTSIILYYGQTFVKVLSAALLSMSYIGLIFTFVSMDNKNTSIKMDTLNKNTIEFVCPSKKNKL